MPNYTDHPSPALAASAASRVMACHPAIAADEIVAMAYDGSEPRYDPDSEILEGGITVALIVVGNSTLIASSDGLIEPTDLRRLLRTLQTNFDPFVIPNRGCFMPIITASGPAMNAATAAATQCNMRVAMIDVATNCVYWALPWTAYATNSQPGRAFL